MFPMVTTLFLSRFHPTTATLKSWNSQRIGIEQGFLPVITRVFLEWTDDGGKLPKSVVLKVE